VRLSLTPRRRQRAAAIASAVALLVGGIATAAALPASAASATCSVTYTVSSQWTGSPNGMSVNVSVTNLGSAVSSWTLGFAFPAAGQAVGSGWSATWSQTGQNVTATNLSYNGSLATNGTTSMGFNGTWTTSDPVPTAFTLNGATCAGSNPPPTTVPPTTVPPTTVPPTTVPPTTVPPTTVPPTSPPPTCSANCPPHVTNPYVGAKFYVNPEWASKANAEPGGSRVSGFSTAIWLDSMASIQTSTGHMGLADHLNAALSQMSGSTPVAITIVIYDLPGRDCAALASNGEIPQTGISTYEHSYIDPIVSIVNQAKYFPLHVVAIIEPDSLPNLVTNASGQTTATANCTTMLQNGNYEIGVEYALNRLHTIPNVYNYVDAAHHGWLGWSANLGPAATEFAKVVRATTAGFNSVDGFITNTANYSVTVEPFFTATTTVGNGTSVQATTWVAYNQSVDELTYAQMLRTQLIMDGFPSSIGMLIDTSRNGWGNCSPTTAAPCAHDGNNRPTAASTSTDPNTFVDQSRVDRRINVGNWCNQSGAGLGARPAANPGPTGILAYVWIKPPGESDGSSSLIPQGPNNPNNKGFDQMCDPTYTGNPRNGNSLTGALPNAPVSGAWFSTQFRQLMADAFPAL
jgi:cellulose 1,4-beta-cellobiosidase